jgi:glycosyltransferase involved in cell wall biosynthesis
MPTDVIHLGSYAHERYSVQREVLAVTDHETSSEEAARAGVCNTRVMCWHYDFWGAIPPERKSGSRVTCFFHHHLLHGFDDPQVVAGVCMNQHMFEVLRQRQPQKRLWIARVGGVESARPYARRSEETDKIRLLLVGNPRAPLTVENQAGNPTVRNRKGPELLRAIADRLDRGRYAWILIGPNWTTFAEELTDDGWTVVCPGYLPDPEHYTYFGEGDIYLMLSQIEGGPLPLLEAMGVGIWPICTATGLAPELIQPGENGQILPAFDGQNGDDIAAAAAQAIMELEPTQLKDAARRVRESVADRTWANFKIEMDAILRESFDVNAR